MSQLALKHKSQNLAVLAVNVNSGESSDVVSRFADDQNLKLTFLQGGEGVALDYEVHRVPTTVLIDPAGGVIDRWEGFSQAKLEGGVESLLSR